jgi:hypothetical protein
MAQKRDQKESLVVISQGRYQKEKVDAFSIAARLDVSKKKDLLVLTLRLYPLFSDNRVTNYQPNLVTKAGLNRVRRLLVRRSPQPQHLRKALSVGEDEVGRDGGLFLCPFA